MHGSLALAYQLTILTHGGVIMKNFFKNLWDKIKNFVSQHAATVEVIFTIFLVIFYTGWTILMLYQFSGILITGLEKDSAIIIAIAIAGYIFVIGFLYWITFHQDHDKDFRRLKRDVQHIQMFLNLNSLDNTLSRTEFKITMTDQEILGKDLQRQLRDIERKLDDLREKDK